jgi:hypothetical protein
LRRVLRRAASQNKLDGTEDDYLWDSDTDHASLVDDDDESSGEEYM